MLSALATCIITRNKPAITRLHIRSHRGADVIYRVVTIFAVVCMASPLSNFRNHHSVDPVPSFIRRILPSLEVPDSGPVLWDLDF